MKALTFAQALLLSVSLSNLSFAQVRGAEQPTVVSAVAPVFPAPAKAVRALGDVFVDVKIDGQGEVVSARHVDAHPLLRKTIEATARRWKFSPATKGEVRRKARLTFTFRLVPRGTYPLDTTPVFHPPYKVEIRDEEVSIEY